VTVYTLRHVETGRYMPQVMGRSTRGWSWWEPKEFAVKNNPRIFYSLRSAQNARSAWAQGPWRMEDLTGSDGYFSAGDEGCEVVPVNPQFPRKLDDLEIVEFQLIEGEALK
jgi:hypothetical protein